jgi:threonyl-tRNA synthetase
MLKKALDANNIVYTVQEGEGAFYGPKIDMKVHDAMGRGWQCGTIQVDFFQPMNFDLEYIDSDQSRKRPVIIHRAIYGSIERFLGIILEHFKGHFPFWLAPVQIRVLMISKGQDAYAREVLQALLGQGLRVELDESGDQISAQIRRAQVEKIPWMVVIGQKEVDQKTVTLRHTDGKQEFGLSLDVLIERARELNT